MYFARTKAFLYHVIIVLLSGFMVGAIEGYGFEIWQLLLFIEQVYVRKFLAFLSRMSAVTQSNIIIFYYYRECNSFCDLLKQT
jgi:hypothetical protein